MDFIIRTATLQDYDELCRVFDIVDRLHGEALPQVLRNPDGPLRSREFIADVIADENASIMVAKADGHMVGAIHVSIRNSPEFWAFVPRKYANIETISVVNDERRKGIGGALMKEAQKWAQQRGVDSLELGVYHFNTGAMRFYESLGFEPMFHRLRIPLSKAEE